MAPETPATEPSDPRHVHEGDWCAPCAEHGYSSGLLDAEGTYRDQLAAAVAAERARLRTALEEVIESFIPEATYHGSEVAGRLRLLLEAR